MADAEIMEDIASTLDAEAEKFRVFRDAARRRGEADVASGFGDKATGYQSAADLIREGAKSYRGISRENDHVFERLNLLRAALKKMDTDEARAVLAAEDVISDAYLAEQRRGDG